MSIPSNLIPGTASYIAAQQREARREIRERLELAFRQLFELSKTDGTQEIADALLATARAVNAMTPVE